MKKKIFISYTIVKLIVIILFSTGCIQKDRDVFWVDNNFSDDEPVKAVMTLMKDSINKREISPLLTCFDESLNFPGYFKSVDKSHISNADV
ncbi:MAG TPA: hypothetical protein PK467_04555 [Candidatus Wallbacteria bacterium]|nr:hypothetical protein [Candidatus Wallbacteria bacterium]